MLASNNNDLFELAGRKFSSRLLVGTGRFKSFAETKAAIEASGAEIVTVAVRRVNLASSDGKSLQDFLDPKKYTFLPNSAGCFTAEEAVRTLRLAREAGGWSMVKLEVIGDKENLLPDVYETVKATEILAKEGFKVMAYTNDDLVIAKRLENAGAIAVMPLAAPIGSGIGILNPNNIKIIVEEIKVSVLVDAGIGTASDATIAMELGCAGVLLNTAISDAKNPLQMASAMRHAVIAGREAFLAGRMPKREEASASTTSEQMIK